MMRPVIGAVASVLVLTACRGETSMSEPIVPLRNMFDQQRYDPQEASEFFSDGRAMRQPVEHTVAREEELDPAVGDGLLADGSGYVLQIPTEALNELGGMETAVARGHDRYNIYCRPCHDGTGSGKGTAVERGMAAPTTFHDDRIRQMPDGQMFATISNGVRNMPAYKAQVPISDRWAIVTYVRALQVAQPAEAAK